MIGVGEKFPAFTLQGVDKDNNFVTVSVTEQYEPLKKDYTVIYFYPKDFTFICPTEIQEMDILTEEAIVMGVSADNEFCKLAWKQDNQLISGIRHTLAADCGLNLADECRVIDHQENVALRATFIMDPNGIVKHASCNALDTGRNAKEILRTLQALKAGGMTGCSWEPGDQLIA